MIIQGDCLEELKKLEENSIDSIVTDPPYGLSFMGKKWDYDVPSVEIWSECLRVLKPGGYLLSFAGTRTQHRMAVRIEDAGFEIRDMIAWIYGSGFPKSLNIGKAVDKLQGNNREITKIRTDGNKGGGANTYDDDNYVWDKPFEETKGTSEWEGWGTALKPAVEPISVCTKPLQLQHIFAIIIEDIWKHLLVLDVVKDLSVIPAKLKEVANIVPEIAKTSVLENTDIVSLVEKSFTPQSQQSEERDTTKVDSAQEPAKENGKSNISELKTQTGKVEDVSLMDISTSVQMGNISENIVLSWKNISEELLAQSNKLTISTAIKQIIELRTLRSCLSQNIGTNTSLSKEILPNLEPITVARKPLSEKTVALNCLKWGVGGIDIDGCRVGTEDNLNGGAYSKGEYDTEGKVLELGLRRQEGNYQQPTGRFPANLIHDGSIEVLSLFPNTKSGGDNKNIRHIHPIATAFKENMLDTGIHHGDSGSAARFFYVAKASRSERQGSTHPTMKPIKLMEYLVKLVSREGATVLDPFAGSGSTGIACQNLNRKFILIEKEPEYIEIIKKRLGY